MEITAESPRQEAPPQQPEGAMETPDSGVLEAPRGPDAAVDMQARVATAAPPPQTSAAPKDETASKVEKVLEENMEEAYKTMPKGAQIRFRLEGERVTREIVGMIASFKVKAAKVLDLISRWLKIIPGVNKFFLIQEAKIKTDKVVALAEEEKKKQGLA